MMVCSNHIATSVIKLKDATHVNAISPCLCLQSLLSFYDVWHYHCYALKHTLVSSVMSISSLQVNFSIVSISFRM